MAKSSDQNQVILIIVAAIGGVFGMFFFSCCMCSMCGMLAGPDSNPPPVAKGDSGGEGDADDNVRITERAGVQKLERLSGYSTLWTGNVGAWGKVKRGIHKSEIKAKWGLPQYEETGYIDMSHFGPGATM